MSSVVEEVREIEKAVECIMFDEIIKEILGREVENCAAVHYEEAYNQVITQAFPQVAHAVDRHVSFKHIFDTNCRRLGLYEKSFIQKLQAILDDRVKSGKEVIPGGRMGTDFDMQLRLSLVRHCGGDARHEREKFLRPGQKAEPKADVQITAETQGQVESRSDKDESALENVDQGLGIPKKKSTSPTPASSKESYSRKARE